MTSVTGEEDAIHDHAAQIGPVDPDPTARSDAIRTGTGVLAVPVVDIMNIHNKNIILDDDY